MPLVNSGSSTSRGWVYIPPEETKTTRASPSAASDPRRASVRICGPDGVACDASAARSHLDRAEASAKRALELSKSCGPTQVDPGYEALVEQEHQLPAVGELGAGDKFEIKVHNEAGVTAPLGVISPNAEPLVNRRKPRNSAGKQYPVRPATISRT